MLHKIAVTCALLLLVIFIPPIQAQEDALDRELIYGWHLMSRDERLQYKAHLRHMQDEAQREAYRREHRHRMRARAERLGIELEPMEELEEDEEANSMSGRIRR